MKAYVYAVMIAASADFSTPIGYQTNFMVRFISHLDLDPYLSVGSRCP